MIPPLQPASPTMPPDQNPSPQTPSPMPEQFRTPAPVPVPDPPAVAPAPLTVVPAQSAPNPGEDPERREAVIEMLRTVYDPEIPVNIWELGLIYALTLDGEGGVIVTMTLTTPNCPVAEDMPGMVRNAVCVLEWVVECRVDLTWEPPWAPEFMSEASRLQLDMWW